MLFFLHVAVGIGKAAFGCSASHQNPFEQKNPGATSLSSTKSKGRSPLGRRESLSRGVLSTSARKGPVPCAIDRPRFAASLRTPSAGTDLLRCTELPFLHL